jgi:hypothetical protein
MLALSLAAANSPAPQIRPLQGTLTEARSTAQWSLFIWNATPYVAQLVKDQPGNQRLGELEATALRALIAKARASKSRLLTLRVLYDRTGAVNPIYNSPVYAGTERVLTMSALRSALQHGARLWLAQMTRAVIPKGLTITVTGKLPPG